MFVFMQPLKTKVGTPLADTELQIRGHDRTANSAWKLLKIYNAVLYSAWLYQHILHSMRWCIDVVL